MMNDSIKSARIALDSIRHEVSSEAYKKTPVQKKRRGWGGADVLITSRLQAKTEDGFYAEPRTVITPNAYEIGWLFDRLKYTFRGLIDHVTKIEFYGRLANAALRYQGKNQGKEEPTQDILDAILDEAYTILEEMNKGTFQYFDVAPSGLIVDDLKDDKS